MNRKHSRNRFRIAVAVAAFVAVSLHAQTLEVVGSSSAKKRLFGPTEAALKAATGVEVKQVGANSGTGLITVSEGRAVVTATSASLDETIAAARKDAAEKGKTYAAPANLVFHEIAQDRIVVMVNRDNPVKSLSKAQLKEIFTGATTNWKQLGGADLPIKIITGTPGSGTREHLQRDVLGKAAWAAVAEMRTSADEVKAVGLEKGGIGAVGEDVVLASPGGTRIVSGYVLARPVGFITLGTPTPQVQKMIDFLKSPEAKKLYAR